MKTRKDKIVQAYPQVTMLAEICIVDNKIKVPVGGFNIDGGFYLREGFDLVKVKTKNVMGEPVTYFNFIKLPKKKGIVEKHLLRQEKERKKWENKREKELKKELLDIEKKRAQKSTTQKAGYNIRKTKGSQKNKKK